MADQKLPIAAFQALIQPLIGLPVSLPWKGHGTAIFLELGALAPDGCKHSRGAAVGEIPELVVHFSNGDLLRTMIMVKGQPEWSIRCPDGDYIYAGAGDLRVGEGVAAQDREVDASSPRMEATAQRWGVPRAEPAPGHCKACAHYVWLDGESSLLDYGACISPASPFDGRVVNYDSGCPAFTALPDEVHVPSRYLVVP